MATEDSVSRLTTFQHHIDGMRDLVMCKICLKPLYEPFILSCGHTYCYGCLRSWFCGPDRRRKKKNCPDCRTEIRLTPSPNYILRDLVHMFISNAELVPEGETVDEHVAGRMAEAELLTNDKDSDGLFQGIFQTRFHPLAELGPLHDIADGVLRCPHCHWEIEDGMCEQCGYEIDDDEDYPDFSDEDDDDSMMEDDGSIRTDNMSNESGQESIHGLPHHFYGAHTAVDEVDGSVTSEVSSNYRFPDRHPYAYDFDEDEEDMDGFIDDHEVDEEEEVDEDDMDDPIYRQIPIPRSGVLRYRVIDSEDEGGSQLEDDDEDAHAHAHRPYRWQPAVVADESEVSDNDDGSAADAYNLDDPVSDQQTNYDESDDQSRSATPTAFHPAPRRRFPVISDDEEEEEDEEADVESRTEGRSPSVDIERTEHVSSDSDDTATPPQPSVHRRQRLDIRRKRRQTPDNNWRSLARGRDRSTSQRDSQAGSRDVRHGRVGANFLGVPS